MIYMYSGSRQPLFIINGCLWPLKFVSPPRAQPGAQMESRKTPLLVSENPLDPILPRFQPTNLPKARNMCLSQGVPRAYANSLKSISQRWV